MSTTTKLLDRALAVALVGAAFGAIMAWYPHLWANHFPPPPPGSSITATQYEVGDQLHDVPELAFLRSREALLIYINESCRFCRDSMPFYRKIINERNRLNSGLVLVVAARDEEANIREYIATHGVQADAVVRIPIESDFRQGVVPSVLLLDGERQVRGSWTGVPDATEEMEILDAITSRSSDARRRAP
jgi:hypothetical protein